MTTLETELHTLAAERGFATAKARAVLRLRRLRAQVAAGPLWSFPFRLAQMAAIDEAVELVQSMKQGADDAA